MSRLFIISDLHLGHRNTEEKPWSELLQTHINFLKGIGYEIPSEENVV